VVSGALLSRAVRRELQDGLDLLKTLRRSRGVAEDSGA
jgi:hypothetical protein